MLHQIQSICSSLHNHSVEFMLVGGTAVALHGYYRESKDASGNYAPKPDIDIWFNPTYKNYFNLLDAIEEIGIDTMRLRNEKSPNPKKSYIKYELDDFTLDFLPSLKANLDFWTSFKRREVIELDTTNIPFIGLNELILDKQKNGRPKDLEDIEELKKRK